MSISTKEAKKYLENMGFNIDLDYNIWQESLDYFCERNDLDGLVKYMAQIQNCGGYTLNVPICIWPVKNYTFEEKVLRIMELYPFVRLLSTSTLTEIEYIVKYRAGESGHHFIKIEDNEEIEGFIDITKKDAPSPLTFERSLKLAYQNELNSFRYNEKEFFLKVGKDDKSLIYICDINNTILGTLCTDCQTFIFELEKDKENEIFRFKPDELNVSKNSIDPETYSI